MRIAVIDLGTNTFNLLIAELQSSKVFRIIYNTKLPVKLGKGSITTQQLMPDAMERGIVALEEFKTIIEKNEVEKMFAFATSAIREASNDGEFIKRANDLGIAINIISGEKEAELIYKGVQLSLNIGDTPALIMDIGGGSTEFIIANKHKLFWKKSFLLGVSRLLEKFNPSDPIHADEITQLESHFELILQPLFEVVQQFPVHELIGSSGSFDSYAEIVVNRFYTPEILTGKTEYVFNLNEVGVVFNELIHSGKEKRLQMKGLVEMRVDMIVMAALMTRFILKELQLTHMRLSTFSLKEGAMHEIMNEMR